jgi:hypothetical protein
MALYSLAYLLGSTQQLQPKRPSGVRSARSQNRGAAWAYDLAQWREYRLAMARTAAERESIEVEYASRLEAGPDFCGYRTGSGFNEPHAHVLDKAGRQAILTAFDQVRAWLYRNNRKPRGQAVSRVYREVLSVLLSFALKFGRAFPARSTIARLACCSERTVDNALAWLRLWGFLSWQRRIKRVATRLGVAVRQTSNAYRIALSGLAALGSRVFSQRAARNNCAPSPLRVPAMTVGAAE